MVNSSMEFEWDLSKEKTNLEKHGISFLEAIECFSDQNGIQFIDSSHSDSEERFYWVGKDSQGRVLTTRFVKRGNKIRIFGSAEWRKFRKLYENAKHEKDES